MTRAPRTRSPASSSRRRGLRWSLWIKIMLAGTVLAGGVAIYLNAWLTAELGARQWQVPARVFARPLVLYPGQPLTADELRRELALLGYRQAVGRAEHPGEAVFNGERVEIHARPFAFSDGHRGSRRWTLEFAGRQLRQLRDDSGQALDLARLDPVALGSIYTSHREDRVLVRLEEVPPLLLDTLLLVEDRDFWRHWGLSLKGIARAAAVNLRAGRTVQGGSTLTQQLVKNALLSRHRSWHRKLLEALLARWSNCTMTRRKFSRPMSTRSTWARRAPGPSMALPWPAGTISTRPWGSCPRVRSHCCWE